MPRLIRLARFAVLALLASPPAFADTAPAQEPDPRRFQALDVFGLEFADDPQISPDGRRIVYVRNSFDDSHGSADARACGSSTPTAVVTARCSRIARATPRRAGRPTASASPTSPAPRAAPQLFVRWMDSGQSALITNLLEAPERARVVARRALARVHDARARSRRSRFAELPPRPKARSGRQPPTRHRHGRLPRRRRGLPARPATRTSSSCRRTAARRAPAHARRLRPRRSARVDARRAHAARSPRIATPTGSSSPARASCTRSTSRPAR